ncbi:hypothetical protein V8B97DRAFT_974040 [Scleroderma yunnanense]
MLLLPFTTKDQTHGCRDLRLRFRPHKVNQRFMDPETGRCTRLRIQAVHPAPKTDQVKVTDNVRRAPKLAVSLFQYPPKTVVEALSWPFRFLICSLVLLFWPIDGPPGRKPFTGEYPPYLMTYWGQMWSARSKKEYSIFETRSAANPMPTLEGCSATVESVTHTLHPRKLVIHRSNRWEHCEDPSIIINYRYIAISYRQTDIFRHGTDDKGRMREKEQKRQFIESVRATTLQCGMQAYWLDLECVGETTEEKNTDVYRMADIYRSAIFTLITIRKSDDPHSIQGWKSWGARVWTFPEALLSRELRYRIGIDGPVLPITLHELANKAYRNYSEETTIINAYGGRDPLERLERLTLLKSAIWRRGSSALPPVLPTAPPRNPEKSLQTSQLQFAGSLANLSYPAEKVYALMGFFGNRIMPSRLETELQALARLLMANDNDLMAERMISMLPKDIQPKDCWYADDDVYGAHLWDIKPEVQVTGTTVIGALVLDGCRAATIRWKNFPEVGFQTTESLRRNIAGSLPTGLWALVFYGAQWMPLDSHVKAVGIVILSIAAFLFVFGPFLTAYAISGRILNTQPWLIGVKGVLSPDDAAVRVYGATLSKHPRLLYTPSGSPFSEPSTQEVREGLDTQYKKLKDEKRDDVYTLIDTNSATIYYFTAKRPPTVCLFTGCEGGLGRFLLCSENCGANELHKETVLRMPTYIHRAMKPCDWVAIRNAE